MSRNTWSGWKRSSRRDFGRLAIASGGLMQAVAAHAWAVATEPAVDAATIDALQNGLQGWQVEGKGQAAAGPDAKPVWSCEDGVVRCAGKGFGFLRFDRQLQDFRLELDYRFPKKGNSGIGIRTIPFTEKFDTRPSVAAYEVQLLSDAGTAPGKGSCASLYGYVAPSANTSRPVGEWNSMVIECRGPRIRVIHNGTTVIDFDQTTLRETAKKSLSGSVCLQNHGSVVEFRKILVTDMSATGTSN